MRVNVTEKLNKKGKYRILMQKELENKMGNWDELGLAIFYLPRAQSDNIVLRGHGESGQSHTGPIILLGMPGDRISALCSPTNMEKCKRQKKKKDLFNFIPQTTAQEEPALVYRSPCLLCLPLVFFILCLLPGSVALSTLQLSARFIRLLEGSPRRSQRNLLSLFCSAAIQLSELDRDNPLSCSADIGILSKSWQLFCCHVIAYCILWSQRHVAVWFWTITHNRTSYFQECQLCWTH